MTLSHSQSETMKSTDSSTKLDSNTHSNSTLCSLVASRNKNKTEQTSKISKPNSHSHSCWARNSLDFPSSKLANTHNQMISLRNSNFSNSNSSSNCNNSSSSRNKSMKKKCKDQLLLLFNNSNNSRLQWSTTLMINLNQLQGLILCSNKKMTWMLEFKLF